MEEDARFIKRKVKSGSIDVHPMEKALVVNYEVEAVILGENGQLVLSDKKECQKIIRLRNLNQDTDCKSLAEDVINKCRLIHHTKLADVEHLIHYVQSRKYSNGDAEKSETTDANVIGDSSNREKGNLLKLESYVELLYEDMFEKIKGSAYILDIAKEYANLEELATNESLLSALSRVLREDWKKSLDLSINIVNVFLCFSMYSTFHGIISQYKVGSLCMEIIQRELKQYHETMIELGHLSNQIKPNAGVVHSKLPLPRSMKSAVDHKPRSNIPVPGSYKQRISNSRERPESASSTSVKNVSNADSDRSELKKRTLEKLVQKQNRLLLVCFNLLLNISDNEKIEDKIRKRNIIQLLISTLDATSIELVILVVLFLKKLSVYRENKDQMLSLNIIEKLPKIAGLKNKKLENNVLRLLYNLSFDSKTHEKIGKFSFISDIVGLLETCDESNKKFALGILYHISTNDAMKQCFTDTGYIAYMNKNMFDMEDNLLLAIYLNVSLNSDCVVEMANEYHISALMKHAFKYNDILLIKIARNLSTHKSVRHFFAEYSNILIDSIINSNDEDFVVECMGLLANLSTNDIDFYQLLQTPGIVIYITKCLTNGVSDDLVLEVIKLLGVAAYDENCAELFHEHEILTALINLLKDKQEDDEIVLQIIYVFYQTIQHPFTRDYLIKCTDAPAYFIDLMHDNNANIRKLCRMCLETIKDFDESWTDRIKCEKFQWHNSNWLEMIQNQILDKTPFLNNDDDFPHFNLLHHSSIFHSSSHMSLSIDGNIDSPSTYHSAGSSRCISRPGSDTDEFDIEIQNRKTQLEKQDLVKDAFKNLVITNDIDME